MTPPQNRIRYMTTQELERESSSRDDQVRAELAAALNLPRWVMFRLARDGAERVRRAAAANPTLPDELLGEMCLDSSHSVALEIAKRPGLSPVAMGVLMKSRRTHVKLALAHRADLPAEFFVDLARDEDFSLAAQLAKFETLPAKVAQILASHPRHGLRHHMEHHPNPAVRAAVHANVLEICVDQLPEGY